MAYASHEFALVKPGNDGKTMRSVLEALAINWGRPPKGLIGPELPSAAEHIWHWFMDLTKWRPTGGMGLATLSWDGVAAWARLRRISLLDWEIDALQALDAAFVTAFTPAPKANKKGEK